MGWRRVKWWLVAGVTGAIAFWLFQGLTGPVTIPQFMGQQIVVRGRYPAGLSLPIGWGAHLGVSLAYALLFAVLMLLPSRVSAAARLGIGLGVAALLGWVTTLLTVPAIAATISVLSGHGFPAELPGLNTSFGLPFWNHLLFFGVVWAVYLLIPVLCRKG
jgi:hypothetical protein